MMNEITLKLSDVRATLETAGGKGASLTKLINAGLPVPDGFHITTTAYQQFITENQIQEKIQDLLTGADPENPDTLERVSQSIHSLFQTFQIPSNILKGITQAYALLPGDMPAVAVRSSATAEDLPELSFAGQQDTYLNIQGEESLLIAVKNCWASLWTARAIGYRIRNQIDHKNVSLAVVIQLLVDSESAGILFTANPMNGSKDQIVINAAWGLGEAVVGGLVNPDTLIFSKKSGKIIEKSISDKLLMTVRKQGATEEQDVPKSKRQEQVLSSEKAQELAAISIQIEKLYGFPVDIEWAFADNKFAIVQARPITTLPKESELPHEVDWSISTPKGRFMRSSIVDLMPDPVKPLFATLGLTSINEMMSGYLANLIDAPSEAMHPEGLITINNYVYMRTNYSFKQLIQLLFRILPKYPSLLKDSIPNWQEKALPNYQEVARKWEPLSLKDLSSSEIYAGINEILVIANEHLGALMVGTMGTSAGSETLFTKVYEKMIHRPVDPPAATFLMGFDSIPILGEKNLFDLATWCKQDPQLVDFFDKNSSSTITAIIHNDEYPEEVEETTWREWREKFKSHMKQFGYSIFSLDFSSPLPLDNPELTLTNLKMFIKDQSKNPYTRQKGFELKRIEAVEMTQARLKGLKSWMFNKTLNWAQNLVPLREDGIAEIGLGYPILRTMFHKLGEHFVQADIIQNKEDIYWLEKNEVEKSIKAIKEKRSTPEFHKAIEERKASFEFSLNLTPPPQLPPKDRYMGFQTEGITAVRGEDQIGDILKGAGTSPGIATGVARVLQGPHQFSEMQPGEILIASTTTPAWTPLFTMASGVITDIGGPLSHGSIVAREYGIPAVMGTGVATKRIQSGQTITLNGASGEIFLNPELS
ncbi:MAG: hypothetical protein JEZ06_14045 [Anaerolineaceae bacterium]|nr:hypothetical protein [Anaerolineaceae bacterium]